MDSQPQENRQHNEALASLSVAPGSASPTRWWHWLIYRLFRWVWNPVLANNPQLRRGLVDTLLMWEASKTRFASVDEMLACTAPRFYVEHWVNRDQPNTPDDTRGQ